MRKATILLLFMYAFVYTCTAQSKIREVNMFLGTSEDYGQLAPAASVPFGMVQVCPDSDPRQHAGYDFAQPVISGISINRLSGVGGSGCGGNVSIIPGNGIPEIIKKSEKACPGYYKASLSNGVNLELTATRTTAIERYFFKNEFANVTLKYKSSFERVHKAECNILSDKEMGGEIVASNTCGNGRYRLFYYIHTDSPFTYQEHKDSYKLYFDDRKEVEIRISISSLSVEHAKKCFLEEHDFSFNKIKSEAAKSWEKLLGKIEVKGGSKDDRIIFYTSLFRTCHSPFQLTTHSDIEYAGTDGKIYKADDFHYYSSWSLWDTYRTKFPLIELLEPGRTKDIAISLARMYHTGKKNWSTNNEPVPTVRTEHSIALLLDIYRKGIYFGDFNDVYPKLREEAGKQPVKSPDQCLETINDWWALSEIAGICGNNDEKSYWKNRADSLFDNVWPTEFQNITDKFVAMRNNGLYQGTRWQYRWALPQYIDKMIELVGKETLYEQLSQFFDKNLYNQGNEPDIHTPFIFNLLGHAESTQKIVRRIVNESIIHTYGGNAEYPVPYVGFAFKNAPVGYCPEMDEDDGAMSAWYVFSTIGLYPLIVGEPYYEITSPLFSEVTLNLDGGKKFVIKSRGRRSKESTIKSIELNGSPYNSFRISHSDIVVGGVMVLNY